MLTLITTLVTYIALYIYSIIRMLTLITVLVYFSVLVVIWLQKRKKQCHSLNITKTACDDRYYIVMSWLRGTPYYRLSRLQMSSGTQKINMSRYFHHIFMLFPLSFGYLFYDTYSYFCNKCCIDYLLCMVDVFRLSGTTDYCNFCYHWRQTLAIGTEVLIFFFLLLPVRAPGHLRLDLLAVFDVTFEGLIDQQSVTEDSTRPSFFEHAS